MHSHLRAFVTLASRIFAPDGPVYQIGARWQEDGSDDDGLRAAFGGRQFIGIDARSGPGVDRVEDLANLSLPSDSAGAVVCVETLERVFDVLGTVDEIVRVLAPGGLAIVAAHMGGPPPGYPWDYWRLTPNCLARLLGPLDGLLVGWQGPEYRPHTALAIGCKTPVPNRFAADADEFMRAANQWVQTSATEARPAWMRWHEQLRRWWGRGSATAIEPVQFSLQLPDQRSWRQQMLAPTRPRPRNGTRLDQGG